MSTEPATDSDSSPYRLPRSRSSSIAGPASPESQSSDSPSSSDPDSHLSFPNPTGAGKSLFAMEVDTSSNPHIMDMEADVPFDADFELRQMGMHGLHGVNTFQSYNINLDDVVLSGLPNMNTNPKTDMLMLEEIIKDGAFEPSSTPGPHFPSYPTRSSAFHDLFIPQPPPLIPQSHPQPQPDPTCIDPSSMQQTQPQPYFSANSHAPSTESPLPLFKTEPPGVLLLSPASQGASGASTPVTHDPSSSRSSLLSYDPSPSAVVSCNVVHPHKDACLDLPIFFPSIPAEGTKSRVETQIKLAFELGFPISSSSSSVFNSPGRRRASALQSSRSASSSSSASNSPTASPALGKREVPSSEECTSRPSTHDKVGTYRFMRLPSGTATKRRSSTAGIIKVPGRCADVKAEEMLEMTAEVVCCSPPHALVQSCSSCQSREAKRTARKVAARVRPTSGSRSKAKPKKSSKKGREQDCDAMEHTEAETEEDEDEPNADASIIQFNCAEIVDFGGGSVVLPMRITCYCRHHKEKVGFNIVFTLRDYLGRVVGQGTTPPILITDDHKSNNAVSKLPPMHPLRQALNPPLLPSAMPDHSEEAKPSSPLSAQGQGTGRALAKRRDAYSTGKKHRAKPYDGRPVNRTAGVGPGIEGRQGVVLALHPAHAQKGSASGLADASSRTTTASPSADSPISPAQSAVSSPSPARPETSLSLPSPPQPLSGIYAPQMDMNMSESETSLFRHASPPVGLSSFLPTDPSSPASLFPSSGLSQAVQPPSQSISDPQALSPEHQVFLDTSPFPLYPSIPHAPLPKIHRLIPSSGSTTGGIEITVLGSNFHASLPLECVFGGAVASSTHRWSDNTLVCVLPPRATPGIVAVGFKGVKEDGTADEGGACLFNYVDESDRQLMELALQVVGLKMTGKIEEARDVAMRIVGNTNAPSPGMSTGEVLQMNSLSGMHHSFLGSLGGMDLETLIIKLLTLLDVPSEAGTTTSLASRAIGHQNATGQTLLHLAVILALPALVSCLAQRSIDLDARNTNGLTALHFAASAGWKEGAEILLAAGADVAAVDSMGFTAADRAKCTRSQELVNLLEEAGERANVSAGESGGEGDDEAWHDGDEASEDAGSDAEAVTSWPAAAPPQYTARARIGSLSRTNSSLKELTEPEVLQRKGPSALLEKTPQDIPAPRESSNDKRPALEKQEPSFVGRLQRNLPQGILPNMQIPGLPQLQIPGLPQLQLPEMLAGPWGALPQIPVFPVFVPIPNLPHLPNWPAFPWTDAQSGEKKGPHPDNNEHKHQYQPSFAMLWTAYDNITNNAWRAQWEKWTAQVTALQNANTETTELPPVYTPREKELQSKTEPHVTAAPGVNVGSSDSSDVAAEGTQVASTSRLPATKATRRMGYGTVRVPDTEVDSYYYQPKKKSNHKKDRMLVLFWIPILFIGLAYALYTTVPVAVAGVSRATRRLIPQLPQREETHV